MFRPIFPLIVSSAKPTVWPIEASDERLAVEHELRSVQALRRAPRPVVASPLAVMPKHLQTGFFESTGDALLK
jgi:hypothetical protein